MNYPVILSEVEGSRGVTFTAASQDSSASLGMTMQLWH